MNGVDLVDFYKPDTTGSSIVGLVSEHTLPQWQVLELRTGRHFDNSNLWQANMAGRVQSRKVSFFIHRER